MPLPLLILIVVVTVLNSLAIIALVRQVGLLDVRLRPLPALDVPDGPQTGDLLVFRSSPWELPEVKPQWTSLLLAFVSPTCRVCTPLLPAIRAAAKRQGHEEGTVLITEIEPDRATAYFGRHGVKLPYLSDPDALAWNRIPGTPFAAVIDRRGGVLSAGVVNSLEQIEGMLESARQEGSMKSEPGATLDGAARHDQVGSRTGGGQVHDRR